MGAATKGEGRLDAADRALNRYYTSTGDGRAQAYEPSPGGSDTSPEEAIMVRFRQAERAFYRETRAVLAELPIAVRDVLADVYGRGAGVVSEDARSVKNLAVDRAGLLRIALQPTWGHGSFVRLALTADRARRAFEKRYEVPSTGDALLKFLCNEAGQGNKAARFLAALRDDCETTRSEALAAFDVVRRAHSERRRAELDAKRQREADEVAAIIAKAERRRLERPTGGVHWTDEERARLREQAQHWLVELTLSGFYEPEGQP